MVRNDGQKGKRHGYRGEAGAGRWMVTYASLTSLLLIIFILFFTMSKIDGIKYGDIANSLSLVLRGEPHEITLDSDLTHGPGASVAGENILAADEGAQLDEVKNQMEEFIRENSPTNRQNGQIIIYEQERGLVISFKDRLLFNRGTSDLQAQAPSIIRQVGNILTDLPNYIRVEGHTDDRLIYPDRFSSNWELSVLKASELVHLLHEESQIPAERLSIIGYGEFRPLVPNDNSTNRAMNQRVDIVILKSKYDYFEPPQIE